MTQQMKEALEKRGIIWGARNNQVLENVKKELRKPSLALNQWFIVHGLRWAGTGYSVKIAPQP